MNTFAPYIVESSCILKGGDTADRRMMELNLLIASGKGNVRPANPLRAPMRVLKDKRSNSEVQLIDAFVRAVAEYRKAVRKRGYRAHIDSGTALHTATIDRHQKATDARLALVAFRERRERALNVSTDGKIIVNFEAQPVILPPLFWSRRARATI
jgi:hypothetical protein